MYHKCILIWPPLQKREEAEQVQTHVVERRLDSFIFLIGSVFATEQIIKMKLYSTRPAVGPSVRPRKGPHSLLEIMCSEELGPT